MASQIAHLQSAAYFSSLKTPELESINHYFNQRPAARGELIVIEGGPAQYIYLVGSGVVRIYLNSPDGREQVLYLARPGDSFNDVAIFDGLTNMANASAMSPVLIYSISKADLQAVMARFPVVRESAIKVLAGQIRRMVSLISDLSFKRVTARLAKLLLEQSEMPGVSSYITQQQMATMIGTVREMIGRAIKDLEHDGAIRMERHRILIVDINRLKKISQSFY